MKQRFSAARFAFRRLKAVLRSFFFCWLAFLLAYWVSLAEATKELLDWQVVAQMTAEIFFCSLLLNWPEQEAQRLCAKHNAENDFDISFLQVA